MFKLVYGTIIFKKKWMKELKQSPRPSANHHDRQERLQVTRHRTMKKNRGDNSRGWVDDQRGREQWLHLYFSSFFITRNTVVRWKGCRVQVVNGSKMVLLWKPVNSVPGEAQQADDFSGDHAGRSSSLLPASVSPQRFGQSFSQIIVKN